MRFIQNSRQKREFILLTVFPISAGVLDWRAGWAQGLFPSLWSCQPASGRCPGGKATGACATVARTWWLGAQGLGLRATFLLLGAWWCTKKTTARHIHAREREGRVTRRHRNRANLNIKLKKKQSCFRVHFSALAILIAPRAATALLGSAAVTASLHGQGATFWAGINLRTLLSGALPLALGAPQLSSHRAGFLGSQLFADW